MGKKELDAVVDHLRNAAIDLSTLSRAADPAQIDAMVYVTLLHQYRTEVVKDPRRTGSTVTSTVCDCGWSTFTSPANFKLYQWEVTRHIMADMVDRIFRTPHIR